MSHTTSSAILVIDMIIDFVVGKFGTDTARKIVPTLKMLIDTARTKGIPIIYVHDSHKLSDKELQIWGEHALEGTEGSKIIPELAPTGTDIVVPKCTYSAFHDTELDTILRAKNIKCVILTGVSTDICVQHTAADALFHGYDVCIVRDCTAAIDTGAHKHAIDYIAKVYGADVVDASALLSRWERS
jgi:nicotinamidase-related amidase